MADYLKNRFERETGKSLTYYISIGKIELFYKFLKEVEEANKIFANTIRPFLDPSAYFLELTEARECSISKQLEKNALYLEEETSSFSYQQKVVEENKELSCHFLCNGAYNSIGTILPQVLSKGSFTIGICANKATSYYKTTERQYKALYQALLYQQIPVLKEEKRVKDYKVYMIRSR